jgi:hypothetical protein
MKRLLVVAVSVAALAGGGAIGALAGEVKGPPGTVNNTNTTGALESRELGMRRQWPERPRSVSGADRVTGSDRGGLLEVLRPSEGRSGNARALQGRNRGTMSCAAR